MAMLINALAAPEGLRRPCSHSCSVLAEMPSASANCFWVTVFKRARATSFDTALVLRAYMLVPMPDLIWILLTKKRGLVDGY